MKKLMASVTAFCLLSGCAGSVIGDALNLRVLLSARMVLQ